jgi:hypothetical protein
VLSPTQITAKLSLAMRKEQYMRDFVDILATALVFLLGIVYLYGCDRLKGRRS